MIGLMHTYTVQPQRLISYHPLFLRSKKSSFLAREVILSLHTTPLQLSQEI